MNKVLFFTAGSAPTNAEKTAFETLVAGMYTVEMRNGAVPSSYGANRNEATDFVAGTVPPAFSSVPVWPGADTTTAPTVTAQADIVGTPKVGVAIVVNSPVFSGNPAPSVVKSVKVAGVEVSTGSYTPITADEGKALTVVFTATNSKGTATSTAGPVNVTAADKLYANGVVGAGTSTANGFMTQATTKDAKRVQTIIRNQTPFTLVTAEQTSDNLTVTQPPVNTYVDLPPNSQNRVEGNASKMWVGVKAITPSSVTSSGTLCTIVFASDHNMSNNEILTLIDFVPTGYNSQLYRVTVVNATTLTVNLAASAGAVTTMGKAFPRPIEGVTVQTLTNP